MTSFCYMNHVYYHIARYGYKNLMRTNYTFLDMEISAVFAMNLHTQQFKNSTNIINYQSNGMKITIQLHSTHTQHLLLHTHTHFFLTMLLIFIPTEYRFTTKYISSDFVLSKCQSPQFCDMPLCSRSARICCSGLSMFDSVWQGDKWGCDAKTSAGFEQCSNSWGFSSWTTLSS